MDLAVDMYDVIIHDDGWRHFTTSAGIMWLKYCDGFYYLGNEDNQTEYQARMPDRHVISAINIASDVCGYNSWDKLAAYGLLAPN